eukprot:TRINITY_DN44772_c0_g1_i1.p1 TRINITY_DN44772_c0_g1~~TRINITY_DN44772_c0_g1_i1.p1  ORF type:complete len:184 (+),score=35.99 TRINITY_DN44772_c0_g1_i1:111-662(+)
MCIRDRSDTVRTWLASSVGTLSCTAVYAPMEVVKETCFANACSTTQAIRLVHAQGGLPGFFRGWTYSIGTWLPYLSLYFVLFEQLKSRRGSAGGSGVESWVVDVQCGLGAGAVSAVATYPIDVIKSQTQSGLLKVQSRADVWQAVAALPVQAGARGAAVRALWLAPSSALIVAFQQRFLELLS